MHVTLHYFHLGTDFLWFNPIVTQGTYLFTQGIQLLESSVNFQNIFVIKLMEISYKPSKYKQRKKFWAQRQNYRNCENKHLKQRVTKLGYRDFLSRSFRATVEFFSYNSDNDRTTIHKYTPLAFKLLDSYHFIFSSLVCTVSCSLCFHCVFLSEHPFF